MKWKKKKFIKKGMFIFLILFLMSFICAREIKCYDNPFALWNFNEGNGTNAQDSCYGYNATLLNGVVWTNGKYSNAVEFDGLSSYIDAGNLLNQNMPEFSFSLWANVSNLIAYQTLFQSGNYYTNEFIEAININEGDNNYVLFMSVNTMPIINITNGEWYNVIGTFNGSDNGNVSLYINGVLISSSLTYLSQIDATNNSLLFGGNYANGFILDGVIDDIAFFNRTLTIQEIDDINTPSICDENLQQQIIIQSYPYVDLNTSYPIKYQAFLNNSPVNVGNINMDLTEIDGNISNFDFIWNSSSNDYNMNLIFTQNGDYPFIIHSSCPYLDNITGKFLVRNPFYITFRFFKDKQSTFFNSNKYINDFAYVNLEFSGTKTFFNNNYDTVLEPFISPISDSRYNKPVFHGKYINGNATIKLYEPTEYAIRLIDGQINFNGDYSIPNITKSYGTNIYIGKLNLNNTSTYDIFISEKEIHPYRWLFNILFIISICSLIIISSFLFFMIPNYPSLSLIFGLGGSLMIVILRVIFWFWIG